VGLDPNKTSSFDRLKAVADGLKEQMTVKRSLTVARERQQYMLPRMPEAAGYEFAFVYRPAEHLSGDFCDIIDLGGGSYGVLVGDIAGHGVEAALIMGAARKAMQIYARLAQSPAQTFAWANDDLTRDLDRQTFMTAGYAVLDSGAGSLRYVRAGHTPLLLIGPLPGQWEEVKPGGTSIGVTQGERFSKLLEERALELKPGQAFIQYTDGIVEAHDRRGREFGVDRFIKFLGRHAEAGSSLAATLEALPAELARWSEGAPQEDDITALAVKRLR
jgi:serine phosphatase RsbU (regulator of sigma subunit)